MAEAQGNLFKEVNDLRKTKNGSEAEETAKWTDSFFGRLAANKKFEGLTFFFIGINSLYIGWDADYTALNFKPDSLYDSKMPIGIILMENLFCVYFTGEVVIRFIGFKQKTSALPFPRCFPTDWWFVFDSTLVTMMVLETWIFPIFGLSGSLNQLSVLRLLRLLRISRMARLMKKVPELMIIIKGLIASFRSVSCTAILQVLILYVWSILFVSEYHELGAEDDSEIASYFGTMGKSMFSLFIYGTVLDDVTACTTAIRGTENMFMLSLFIVFILISSFTILNMLIGILCEVVSATAESETTKAAETCFKEAITSIFQTLDADGNGTITEEEFHQMRESDVVCQALQDMDIYDSHFHRYCELLFHSKKGEKNKKIDFDALLTMILRLAPGNHINALDFSLLQASIDRTQEQLRERVLNINSLMGDSMENAKDENVLPQRRSRSKASQGSGRVSGALGNAAKGDSPPPPPTSLGGLETDLRGTATATTVSVPGEPPSGDDHKEYTLDMFVRTSSHEIIQELERRLGVSARQASIVQARSASKDPLIQQPQAFVSLGVPEE